MSRLALLFNRRVPLYVTLPVVVACGVTGLIASTIEPRGKTSSTQPTDDPADPRQRSIGDITVEEPPARTERQRLAELTPSRDASRIAASSVDDRAPPPRLTFSEHNAPLELQRIVKPAEPSPSLMRSRRQRTPAARPARPTERRNSARSFAPARRTASRAFRLSARYSHSSNRPPSSPAMGRDELQGLRVRYPNGDQDHVATSPAAAIIKAAETAS
jgi:hypothetical protein